MVVPYLTANNEILCLVDNLFISFYISSSFPLGWVWQLIVFVSIFSTMVICFIVGFFYRGRFAAITLLNCVIFFCTRTWHFSVTAAFKAQVLPSSKSWNHIKPLISTKQIISTTRCKFISHEEVDILKKKHICLKINENHSFEYQNTPSSVFLLPFVFLFDFGIVYSLAVKFACHIKTERGGGAVMLVKLERKWGKKTGFLICILQLISRFNVLYQQLK